MSTSNAPAQPPKPKRGRGRPSKITPALIQRIADVVRTGSYLDTACRFCGIDKVTFHAWLKKGHEQKRGIYRDFLNAIEEAQAAADVRDHATITKASLTDWKAAAKHLMLRNPGRYAMTRQEISGPDGKPIAVASSTEASLLALFTKLAGGDDEGSGEGGA